MADRVDTDEMRQQVDRIEAIGLITDNPMLKDEAIRSLALILHKQIDTSDMVWDHLDILSEKLGIPE